MGILRKMRSVRGVLVGVLSNYTVTVLQEFRTQV